MHDEKLPTDTIVRYSLKLKKVPFYLILSPQTCSRINREGWGWSASRFPLESFKAALHDHELEASTSKDVNVHIDSFSMGLGGYDSWTPNVTEDYLFRQKFPISFSVAFLPKFSFNTNTENWMRPLNTDTIYKTIYDDFYRSFHDNAFI